MAVVDANDNSQVGWLGLRVGGYPALSLHSSNEQHEQSKLSQWLQRDDSTINVVRINVSITAQRAVYSIRIQPPVERVQCPFSQESMSQERMKSVGDFYTVPPTPTPIEVCSTG